MQPVIIERLGHLGDGIAPGPVYAPGTLPGEVLDGDIDNGYMPNPRIVTPSPDRVAPPCVHGKSCGGCQLQHASEAFTANWKTEIVRTALAAQGLETEFRPIVTSPPQTRRRASFSARRTKKGALAGFHKKRSDVIVPVPNCLLVHPDLAGALPLVEALAVLGGSRKGELSVLVTTTETGLDVSVTGGKPLDSELRASLADIARDYDLSRIAWGDEETLQRRPPVLHFGPAAVTPPPGAFLQATPEGEAALRDAVLEITKGAKRSADLFAGCGTFALPMAQHSEVLAIEGARAMTDALDHGWRMSRGLKAVTTQTRDLFRDPLIAEDMAKLDAVAIDPPRAGAEAQIAELAQAKPAKIAHVSCNPVTFARDAATLVRAGYDLDWLQVVDQFRWSTHIELVASFTLR
ncbi:class I SAM-dependent RNA methyltransferase [Roseivivax sp. THAF197b]|uniref:class I SAM-dependent RNA methyltransferase n=1 Tax=Roseivivax sp. THAF197b TaxID=2588299 RepID=UPI001267AB5F|nr:class I SAM-dependent RNA methyltransferase [Roseivivax sp. THAF197b]QFS84676.1 23S rRNA (uracil(1939)-C(5))-methyltransferase RlmD [Roseivivax sp. THAF197b]